MMGSLFALFSAALSAQPVWTNPFADLRYYVAALPLLLATLTVVTRGLGYQSPIDFEKSYQDAA